MGRRPVVVLATLAATLLSTVALAASSATAALPVSYNLLTGALATAKDPAQPPPGANDFSCRPSAAHPNPVVLVHGLVANAADNWNTMSPVLKNAGYCVFALTYGAPNPRTPYFGGLTRMEDSSHELDAFVTRVLAATGASKVDLVGHSEGTVMPQYWLKRLGGAAKVDKYVALTPLYDGTTVYGLDRVIRIAERLDPKDAATFEGLFDKGICGSCREFLRGSQFLTDLYKDGVAAPGVTYTTIMTRYDELVVPYTSGRLPGATNIVLQDQCPLDLAEHAAVAYDPVAARDVLNALDPAHAERVPCTLVLPLIGAPQAATR
jgi:pimeloyl-ACP methyl ester carboxylesterase